MVEAPEYQKGKADLEKLEADLDDEVIVEE
jgi:hypothetical protein